MEYKGYLGRVEYDDEAGIFHGEVINLREVITFQGKTVQELRAAFRESVDDYLAFCAQRGEEPERPYSGAFTVRISPELHRDIALQARLKNKSLNSWVADVMAEAVRRSTFVASAKTADAFLLPAAPVRIGEPKAAYVASPAQSLRVYVDTSVFGGYFDDEFSVASRQFFDAVFAGQVISLISETLVAELARAPEQVQDLLNKVIWARAERLPLTIEAIALRDAYLRGGVVTQKYADDALHVAQATLARADVIVSWNFRHLVNPARIREFNGINLGQGYGLAVIMTPAELVNAVKAASHEPENDN